MLIFEDWCVPFPKIYENSWVVQIRISITCTVALPLHTLLKDQDPV